MVYDHVRPTTCSPYRSMPPNHRLIVSKHVPLRGNVNAFHIPRSRASASNSRIYCHHGTSTNRGLLLNGPFIARHRPMTAFRNHRTVAIALCYGSGNGGSLPNVFLAVRTAPLTDELPKPCTFVISQKYVLQVCFVFGACANDRS